MSAPVPSEAIPNSVSQSAFQLGLRPTPLPVLQPDISRATTEERFVWPWLFAAVGLLNTIGLWASGSIEMKWMDAHPTYDLPGDGLLYISLFVLSLTTFVIGVVLGVTKARTRRAGKALRVISVSVVSALAIVVLLAVVISSKVV